MKKILQKILGLLTISLLFSGCATSPTISPKVKPTIKTQQGYTVKLSILKQSQYPMSLDNTQTPFILGYDEIKFLPYISKYGSLHVIVHRTSLETANLESFSYVLKKDGRTISKWSGKWQQAEIPINHGLWWNIISIDTKGILRPGVYTLYIKDHVTAVDVREDGLSIFKITVTK